MSPSEINLEELRALNKEIEADREREKKKILAKAELAAAWGIPDQYGIGYTQSDLVSIIRELANYIKKY